MTESTTPTDRASDLARAFMDALKTTESERDPAALLAFFGDDATLRRNGHGEHEGRDGAERFWREYLESFREQTTTFHAVTEADGRIVLEWTSEGTRADGEPLQYSGVSILADAEGGGEGRIGAFRTYFDSASFTTGGAVV